MAAKKTATSDGRLDQFKKSHSGIYQGSVKDILNDSPRSRRFGQGHKMEGTHGLHGLSSMDSGKIDPLRKLLDKAKPETYKEHVDRIYKGGSNDGSMSSRTSSSKITSKKFSNRRLVKRR